MKSRFVISILILIILIICFLDDGYSTSYDRRGLLKDIIMIISSTATTIGAGVAFWQYYKNNNPSCDIKGKYILYKNHKEYGEEFTYCISIVNNGQPTVSILGIYIEDLTNSYRSQQLIAIPQHLPYVLTPGQALEIYIDFEYFVTESIRFKGRPSLVVHTSYQTIKKDLYKLLDGKNLPVVY